MSRKLLKARPNSSPFTTHRKLRPEELLGELAEVVRRAGREFRDELQAEAPPTAGSA